MSRIVGPWSVWRLIDPPSNQPPDGDLIKTLIDFAIDDWTQERRMADEALDWLMGGGGPPAFSFKEEGAQVLGKVLAYEMAQERDFHSKELLTWDDGRPRMQMVITMQSEEHPVTDEDDGKRRLFVKYGAMREAIQKAIKDSGAASIIGGRLWVKHSGYGESKKNPTNPPKAYKAKFGPASAAEMLDQITGPEPEVPTQTATWPEDNEYSTEPF